MSFMDWLLFSLVLVLVMGKEVNGARSWFELGAFGLQPSEFAKFATVLALARYLSAKGRNPDSAEGPFLFPGDNICPGNVYCRSA